jgi:hypothetical protein
MSEAGVHSLLITRAARRNLRPLGLFQKGRSRTWLADQGWWMAVVEFQPSGLSKGSYLNVACMWLWHLKNYISFDFEDRVEHFWRFESEEQFGPVADMLSQRAAEEVTRLRTLFPTVLAASDYFLQNPPVQSFWPEYNAAVAHGLVGRAREGAALLNKPRSWDFSIDWHRRAAGDAHLMAGLIDDRTQFRELIEARIHETRSLLRLPKLEQPSLGL